MWTEKWWDEGRPPQQGPRMSGNSSSGASTTDTFSHVSSSASSPGGGQKLSNGVSPASLFTPDARMSNGHDGWYTVPLQDDHSLSKSSSPSSSPEAKLATNLTGRSSPSPPKPAVKLAKKARTSVSNGKALSGRRLVSGKSSQDLDIKRAQSPDYVQQLLTPSGDAASTTLLSSRLNISGEDVGAFSTGAEKHSAGRLNGTDHSRESSLSSGDWQLSNKFALVNGGTGDHQAAKPLSINTDSNETGQVVNQTSSDRLIEPSSKGIALESYTSNSPSDIKNGVSPAESPSAELNRFEPSPNRRSTSGSTSDHSSWSECSDAASWDSCLRTPPLYDVCDIASSHTNERQKPHRFQSMQQMQLTSSIPDNNPTSLDTPTFREKGTPNLKDSSYKVEKQENASKGFSSVEISADAAAAEKKPYFHASTASTVSPQAQRKAPRQATRHTVRAASAEGPVPLANGHAGKQKAYSLMATDENEESHPVVLYEYERPKRSPEVASESALRSTGTLLSRVAAPQPAPCPDEGPESLRSPCSGLAIYESPKPFIIFARGLNAIFSSSTTFALCFELVLPCN
ncbi:hypothetical protein PoB_005992700 [Plakobranchus ocellatus]|uniref:Uncharacterized protein n=1 Tax=Plakobranchus ocellatus TaxID=259542 RepID=A0AAV4CNH1_9GAST|nr:hypothetical protein PoB_005992700 [Plakobranchus ocellatus]